MQLRCSYCQTMFAISREETLAALERMAENNLKYYDAHCPKCRRANRVERFKVELSYPNWQADLKAMAKSSATAKEAAAESANVPSTSPKSKAAASKVSVTPGKETAKPATKKKPAAAPKTPAKAMPPSKEKATSQSKKK